MTSRPLQILSFSLWLALCVCAMVLLFFAVTIPTVISKSNVEDRQRSVAEIRASTDLHEVQQIAAWRTQEADYLNDAARVLLIISVSALLLCLLCSSICLAQVRRLRQRLERKE